MTYEDLLALAKRAEGEILTTVRGAKFTVGIYMDCPFFVPLSTGQGRSDGRKAAVDFLAKFNQSGSTVTSDYRGVTHNASYFLALIEFGNQSPE